MMESKNNPVWTMEGSTRRLRCIDDMDAIGARFVGYADEIADSGVNHSGWYTDDDGVGEMIRGAVWQLPARKDGAVYVSGYVDPWNGLPMAVIDLDLEIDHEHEVALSEAARSADGLAEFSAELERDDQRKDRHEQTLELALETLERARDRHSANVRAYAENPTGDHSTRIAEVLRDDSAWQRVIAEKAIGEIRCMRCILGL